MVWLLKKRRRLFAGLLTASAIGIVICLFSLFNLFNGIQLYLGDYIFRAANLQAGAEAETNIVIVAIDDRSLDQLGHFQSWPRSYHARLINILLEAEARVVAFDVLFSEPAPDDDHLAASIKHAGNVILPMVRTFTVHHSSVTGDAITFENTVKPLKTFEEGAIATGHANMLPDKDGVVRRLPLVIPGSEYNEPALALATVAKYLRRAEVLESPVKGTTLPFVGRSISLDSTNSMLINYTGDSAAPLSFKTVSYVDVLNNDIQPAVFQDKIIVIGATAAGLGDTFWTPLGRMLNGVELHASAIHTILTGNFLNPAPASITVMSILVLSLLCGMAVLRFRTLWATLLTVFLGIAYLFIAIVFFDSGILVNMLYPPLAIVGTFVGVNVYNVTAERSEKREITRTFGRYVSPSVVSKILTASAEDELKLGGEEHELTVMFADVRSFTSISEEMQPEELLQVLNIHLSAIVNAVLQYDGMINKFAGDSIMAIWNVPIACEEHALLATKAAFSAQRAIRELQDREATLLKMEFGIGVNTGKAVAGSIGSENRMEYSVIGDAVNTAFRLSSAAPGGKVWIGADTFAQAKDYITAEPLEPLSVKGKREPVQSYQLVDTEKLQADYVISKPVNIYTGKCNK